MYTITLNDGTKLKNLELNGNNYIAAGVIEDSVFAGKLASVTITDGKTTETYTDMVLVSNRVEDGHSWFILGEKTARDKALERITAMEDAICEMDEAHAASVAALEDALCEIETDNGGTV